jgi:hypothetical protein
MVVLGPVLTGVADDDQFSSSGRRLMAWRRYRERQSMEEGREDRRQHRNILRGDGEGWGRRNRRRRKVAESKGDVNDSPGRRLLRSIPSVWRSTQHGDQLVEVGEQIGGEFFFNNTNLLFKCRNSARFEKS